MAFLDPPPPRSGPTGAAHGLVVVKRYAVALLICGLLTLALLGIASLVTSASVALLYQLSILVIATICGRGPSIVAALLSALVYDYFFLEPYNALLLTSRDDLIHILTFMGVAVSTSVLASRARAGVVLARQRLAEMSALYELSQLIGAQIDLDQILPAVATTTCRMLGVPACSILLADGEGRLREHARAGVAAPQLQLSDVLIQDGPTLLGVMRVAERSPGAGLSVHERYLLDSVAAQAHRALSRARLMAQAVEAEALARSDQLKSALIASVSHDLRTPLAAIKGAVSTLHLDELRWAPGQQRALTHLIEREADRLNRVIGNLLAMSRIEAGALQLERAWHDLSDLVRPPLERMRPALQGRAVTVAMAADLPLVWCHAGLIDQVLTNLLENALRYTPPGSPLHLEAFVVDAAQPAVALALRDRGPGITPSQLERIFEKFVRAAPPEFAESGSGLGLTICRGIIVAHGGEIWAENCREGGAQFTFTLPLVAATEAGVQPRRALLQAAPVGSGSA
jgi:two-component system, OmpR family, sensor histidine kinase KdpD